MAMINSSTSRKTPRRKRFCVRSRKKRSTMFRHDELAGVKRTWKRGCRFSHFCALAGSGANFERWRELPGNGLWLRGQSRSPYLRSACRGSAELADLKLVLFDFLCELDTANHRRRIGKAFESEHWDDPVFHSPVILFNQVVQVLTGADHHSS